MEREASSNTAPADLRIGRTLTDELPAVAAAAAAEHVVLRTERLAAGVTEADRGDQAARAPGGAAEHVEEAAHAAAGPDCTAAVLEQAAAQVAAPNAQAAPAAHAAGVAMPPGDAGPTPEA